ncbi:hypothetical protein TcWFU_002619 [Taenia crassiceps]|uniref:Uncharacterized protein n=1 Tax=Taenia crassiceps TaxID=6207 RepID=A0ABR4Q6W5_9CEST
MTSEGYCGQRNLRQLSIEWLQINSTFYSSSLLTLEAKLSLIYLELFTGSDCGCQLTEAFTTGGGHTLPTWGEAADQVQGLTKEREVIKGECSISLPFE